MLMLRGLKSYGHHLIVAGRVSLWRYFSELMRVIACLLACLNHARCNDGPEAFWLKLACSAVHNKLRAQRRKPEFLAAREAGKGFEGDWNPEVHQVGKCCARGGTNL